MSYFDGKSWLRTDLEDGIKVCVFPVDFVGPDVPHRECFQNTGDGWVTCGDLEPVQTDLADDLDDLTREVPAPVIED